ncbi:degenerin-like protein asic-2 [Parasteatoda tepidariorum]|uniref:degenerin-like protein asic-2 n=1 Tax=Parasteatoda tepidariorum TaxID=114398 RepID=UPI001C71C4D0|nr:uncharacterized protein LOC107457492 [Parasteatoda tepidariorum]
MQNNYWNQRDHGISTISKSGVSDMINQVKKTKTNTTKYSNFPLYLRTIFKSSLITSFPEIATAKTWVRRVLKILVFLGCLCGFIYQTYNFLILYLSYPTTVNVQITNPFEIVQPALTFCNKNRQRRSVICKKVKNQCTFLPENRFCTQYPRYCPGGKRNFFGVPFLNSIMEDKLSWEQTSNESHTKDIISSCKIHLEGKIKDCVKPYRRVPTVSIESKPNYCYTIESQWEKPNSTDEIHPNTFYYDINLRTQPEEYIVYSDPVQIYVAVHDRRRLVNPYTEGYVLKGGVKYQAYVSMTEEISLPYPYKTDCTDYIHLWRENNGTGPLNQLMCIEFCKLNTLKQQGSCIDENVAYPHEEVLCKKGVVTATSNIVEKCTKQCHPPCNDQRYEVRTDEVTRFDHLCQQSNENCKHAAVIVVVSFQRFRVTKFIYQPKFETVELFSYIGGYMGMWLGLSLVSLFDLAETLAYLFYYPVGRMNLKSKKKKKRRVNPFSQNWERNMSLY